MKRRFFTKNQFLIASVYLLITLDLCFCETTEWGKLDSLDGLFYKNGDLYT